MTNRLDGTAPESGLPMDRPLYTPRLKKPIRGTETAVGGEDFAVDLLLDRFHVDRTELAAKVWHSP